MKRTTARMLAAVTIMCVALQPTLAPASAAPSWLEHLNGIRAMAGILPVDENLEWSADCLAHARYMSLNRVITHSQDPAKPYYSAAGDVAARKSNLALGAGGTRAIDLWAVGPFHAVGMLDPGLRTVGFGSYSAPGAWPSAVLDVARGAHAAPAKTPFPVIWPGPGSVSSYLEYKDQEYPDPLAGTGFTKPSGAPIIVQFGDGALAPVVTASRLRCVGRDLAHAVYTELTYSNTDARAQAVGRGVLGTRDAVVIVPKAPLTPGARYDLSLTVDGRTYEWGFWTKGALRVTLSAPDSCGYGGPALVFAKLTSEDGKALGGREIVIEQSSDGVTWSPALVDATCQAGTVSLSLSPKRRIYVRARFSGDGDLPPVTSVPAAVLPEASIGSPRLPAAVKRSRSFEVTGSLLPSHESGSAAARVFAQRLESGRWVPRASFEAVAGGAAGTSIYRARITLTRSGTWRLRAIHAADERNGRAVSAWRRIDVP